MTTRITVNTDFYRVTEDGDVITTRYWDIHEFVRSGAAAVFLGKFEATEHAADVLMQLSRKHKTYANEYALRAADLRMTLPAIAEQEERDAEQSAAGDQ